MVGAWDRRFDEREGVWRRGIGRRSRAGAGAAGGLSSNEDGSAHTLSVSFGPKTASSFGRDRALTVGTREKTRRQRRRHSPSQTGTRGQRQRRCGCRPQSAAPPLGHRRRSGGSSRREPEWFSGLAHAEASRRPTGRTTARRSDEGSHRRPTLPKPIPPTNSIQQGHNAGAGGESRLEGRPCRSALRPLPRRRCVGRRSRRGSGGLVGPSRGPAEPPTGHHAVRARPR